MATDEEKHNARLQEKIECPGCHKIILRVNISTHMKTAAHQKKTQDVDELMKYREKIVQKYDKKIKTLEKTKKKMMNDAKKQISAAQ